MTSLERPRARQEMKLAQARERYEATPRQLDEHLEPLARGDRGCLGDVLTLVGALVTPIMGLIASRGGLPLLFPLLGVGVVITGIVLQRKAQRRSAEDRTRALTAGPLVLAWLVDPPRTLLEGEGDGKVVRVIGVFSPTVERRFDAEYLSTVASGLANLDRSEAGELAELFANQFALGLRPVPASVGALADTYAARVVVHPERLDGGLTQGYPAIPCIVDVEHGFIEHV